MSKSSSPCFMTGWKSSFSFCAILVKYAGASLSCSLSFSIFVRSRTSLIRLSRMCPEVLIFPTQSRTRASSSGWRSMISANPRIALMGVRMSWDIFARKIDLTFPASSAFLEASFSISRAWFRLALCISSRRFFCRSAMKR